MATEKAIMNIKLYKFLNPEYKECMIKIYETLISEGHEIDVYLTLFEEDSTSIRTVVNSLDLLKIFMNKLEDGFKVCVYAGIF